MHGDEFCSVDGNISLLTRVAALHVVYHMSRSQVLWFGQLVALQPEALVHLKKESVCDKSEMVRLYVHVYLISTNWFINRFNIS